MWFEEAMSQVNAILTKCLEEPMELLNSYKEFNWVIESDNDVIVEDLRNYKEKQKALSTKVQAADNEEEQFDEDGNLIRRESVASKAASNANMVRRDSKVSKASKEDREEEMKQSMAKMKATKRRKSHGDLQLEERKSNKKK